MDKRMIIEYIDYSSLIDCVQAIENEIEEATNE